FQAEGIALVEKKGTKSRVITDGPDPSALLAWIKAGEDLPLGMLGTFLSWLIPLATLAGIGLQATRGFHPITWVLPLALGLIVLRLSSKATSETFAAVSTTEGAFLRYGALLSLLEK